MNNTCFACRLVQYMTACFTGTTLELQTLVMAALLDARVHGTQAVQEDSGSMQARGEEAMDSIDAMQVLQHVQQQLSSLPQVGLLGHEALRG